ncbi:MAG: hypothetical protein V4858_11350 [Pseudomonadota bacterium]
MYIGLNISRITVSAVLYVGLALTGCANVATSAATPSLQQRVEAAHTRGDHMALATHYSAEATAARAKAAEHRDMITAYVKQLAGGRGNANMQTHCNSLIMGYESIAADYERMAASHQQLAAQAKQP